MRVPALMAAESRTLTGRPPAMQRRTRPLRVRSESRIFPRIPRTVGGPGLGPLGAASVAGGGGRGGEGRFLSGGKDPRGRQGYRRAREANLPAKAYPGGTCPSGALRKCPGGVLEPRFARLPPSRWDLHYHLIKKHSKKNKKRCCCPSEGEGALELVMCGNQPRHPGRYVCAFLPGAALPT